MRAQVHLKRTATAVLLFVPIHKFRLVSMDFPLNFGVRLQWTATFGGGGGGGTFTWVLRLERARTSTAGDPQKTRSDLYHTKIFWGAW